MKVKLKKLYTDLIKEPLYILFHPIKGYDEFKNYGMSKMYVAITFLILTCLLQIISFNGTGFLVNNNNPKDFNALVLLLNVVVIVLLGTFGNWSITTLVDGKGKVKEIFMMICYSLFPFMLLGFINLLFSRVLTNDEKACYSIIRVLSIALLCYMLFFGFLVVHDFGVFKTILTIILTVIAIALIIFIFLLFFSLLETFFTFVKQLIDEFRIRLM